MTGNNSTPNNSDWVRLNVGGKVFQTTKDTLSRHPESFLARLVNGGLPSDKDESGAYLIDGNPEHFDTILTYLRRGVLNLDGNDKTAKDLLSEADFYNVQALVDEIRKAMIPVSNRCETIILYVGYHSDQRNTDSYIVCSEKHDDYEILQALRLKITMQKCDDGKYKLRDLSFEKQIDIEMILHSFGFREESFDNNYDKGDSFQVKCWKFIRTVRK